MTGIGLGVAFVAGIGLGTTGVILVLAIALFLWSGSLIKPALVGLAIVLGVLGAWRVPELPASQSALSPRSNANLTAIVDSFPVTTSRGQMFDIRVEHDSDLSDIRFCVVSDALTPVEKGSTVRLEAMVTPIDDLAHSLQGALGARDCAGSIATSEIVMLEKPTRAQALINAVRNRISDVFQRVAPGDTGALMTGLVTGDDSALSASTQSAFLATGTTHITAVSGSNFALIALIATTAARGAGMRRRLPWIAATAATIWVYAILVGLPPSALRAALMATGALIAVRFGRRPDFLTLLVLCGALQIGMRPSDLHSLSFQLSIAATLALVLVFAGREIRIRQLPVAFTLTAFAAHLATVPVLAFRLEEFAPATVPTNILISPLTMIGFSLAAFASVVGLLSETVGIAAATPAAIVSSAIVAIVTSADNLLPGRISTGAASSGSLLALAVVCWSIVLWLSADVRTSIGRGWEWLVMATRSTHLAFVAAPVIAILIYTVGSLAR